MGKKINIFNAHEIVNGDMAKEALVLAEQQFLNEDFDKSELNEGDDGINAMYYKDDDGYWRVTDSDLKFDSYEDLAKHFGL